MHTRETEERAVDHRPEPTLPNQPSPSDDTPPAGGDRPDIRAAWDRDRPYVVGLATRMLADRAEAEDVVQEAFAALADVPPEEIRDHRAWLAVVVRRRCLNRLRSAYRRRETPSEDAGELFSPLSTGAAEASRSGADPADRVSLDEQVRLAMAVLVDRLSPAERTAFLLHDVFGFPFEAIADVVGRSPAACRQLASRGRRSLQRGELLAGAAPSTTIASADLVTERFIAACAGGDLDELLAVLDPEVVGHATVLGTTVEVHAEGAAEVAPALLHLYGPDGDLQPLPLDLAGRPGIVASGTDGSLAVVRFDIVEDRIAVLRALVRTNPERVAAFLGRGGTNR